MALSEDEQRLLDQLEASLTADDPRLAQTLSTRSTYTVHKRRATLGGVGFLVGVALLIAGFETSWIVGVLGFLVMFASTVLALTAWQKVEQAATPAAPRQPRPTAPQNISSLEDRWRRRQQGEH